MDSNSVIKSNTVYTVKTKDTVQKYRVKNNVRLHDDLVIVIFKHITDMKLCSQIRTTSSSIKSRLDLEKANNRYDFLLQFAVPSTDNIYYDVVKFSVLPNGIRHGPFKICYLSGQIERNGVYVEGKLHGDVFNFHANGAIYMLEKFVMGLRVNVVRYDV